MANPILTLTTDGDSVLADWNLVSRATEHKLRRALFGSTNFVTIVTKAGTQFTDVNVEPGEKYSYYVRAYDSKGNLLGTSTTKSIKVPAAAPDPEVVVGHGAGTVGGTGGTAYTVSTYADLVAKVALTNRRTITFGANIDGQGATLSIDDGDLTIDGAGKQLKRCNVKVTASEVIIKQLNVRPGDDVDNVQSGGCITLNSGLGNTISNIVIDHCSMQWATDVCMNFFNRVEKATIQYCIIGPAITSSDIIDDPNRGNNQGTHGYGLSFHTDPDPNYCRNVSVYRNFLVHNRQRNLRGHHAVGIDFVNNVVYNFGNKGPAMGDFRGVNYIGNMFKKGPNSTVNAGFTSELSEEDTAYLLNGIYYPDGSNIGLGFTPDNNFADGVRRGSFYPQGATGPFGVTPVAASAALAAEVVAAAGPTLPDTGGYNAIFKGNFTATPGTGSHWNGVGKPGPNAPW